MRRLLRQAGGDFGGASRERGGGAPGKQTLTEGMMAPPSGGAALPPALQTKFEGSLGADLGGVRVHNDTAAAAQAGSVGARAFALGQDVFFGAGYYDPGTPAGEHLLAHEVAHTVQQEAGPRFSLEVSQPGDAVEVEADRAADAMVAGRAAAVGSATGPARVMRKEEHGLGGPEGGELMFSPGAGKSSGVIPFPSFSAPIPAGLIKGNVKVSGSVAWSSQTAPAAASEGPAEGEQEEESDLSLGLTGGKDGVGTKVAGEAYGFEGAATFGSSLEGDPQIGAEVAKKIKINGVEIAPSIDASASTKEGIAAEVGCAFSTELGPIGIEVKPFFKLAQLGKDGSLELMAVGLEETYSGTFSFVTRGQQVTVTPSLVIEAEIEPDMVTMAEELAEEGGEGLLEGGAEGGAEVVAGGGAEVLAGGAAEVGVDAVAVGGGEVALEGGAAALGAVALPEVIAAVGAGLVLTGLFACIAYELDVAERDGTQIAEMAHTAVTAGVDYCNGFALGAGQKASAARGKMGAQGIADAQKWVATESAKHAPGAFAAALHQVNIGQRAWAAAWPSLRQAAVDKYQSILDQRNFIYAMDNAKDKELFATVIDAEAGETGYGG